MQSLRSATRSSGWHAQRNAFCCCGGKTVPDIAVPAAAPPMISYAPPMAAPAAAVILPAPYAGFWLRFVAYLIDGAIMGVVFGIIIAIALATVGVRFFREFVPGAYDRPANPVFPAAVLGVIRCCCPSLWW